MPHREIKTGLWALIPMKPLGQAKSRLGSILPQSERQTLSLMMFREVLQAATRCRDFAGTLVITGDAHVAVLAERAGAQVAQDPGTGLNAALQVGADAAADLGATAICVVPADLPRATPHVLAEFAAHHQSGQITLAPAIRDGGTNGLIMDLSAAIPFCFGPDSLRRHAEAAHAADRPVHIEMIDGLSVDMDRPEDLAGLAQPEAQEPGPVAAWLRSLGWLGSRPGALL